MHEWFKAAKELLQQMRPQLGKAWTQQVELRRADHMQAHSENALHPNSRRSMRTSASTSRSSSTSRETAIERPYRQLATSRSTFSVVRLSTPSLSREVAPHAHARRRP